MGCVSSKSHGRGTRNSLSEYQLTDTPGDAPVVDLPPSDTAHGVPVVDLPQSDTAHDVPVVDLSQSDIPGGHDDQTAGSSATPTHSLWDRHNSEQQGLVLQSDRYRDVLRDKLTDLVQSVEVKPMMPVLRQLHVIDADRQDRIEFQAPKTDMVMRLVDHVEQGPLWRLHGMLRALAVTNQEYLIDQVLGLDRADYEDPPTPDLPLPSASTSPQSPNTSHQGQQKQHFYKRADSGERMEIPMSPLPGIIQHCERSQRMLMKGTLFGFDDNTPIDLTPIYINQNPDCKVNQREVQSTMAEELFLKLFQPHSPNTLLLEGDAGTGKSTFLHQYAHTCCKELVECHKKGPESPCEGHTWALVTYIAAGSITGSQVSAIRDNLQCDEKLKDQVMAMITENGEGVLLINDGIDELRKEPEMESLRSFTASRQKDGSPKVLVSSRVSLCRIEGKFFDRHLVMKGFSVDQGLAYMQEYLKTNHHLTEHPVLDHIIGNRKDFEWVLMNPLRVHILSEVTARGAITLEDVKSLTTVKLLKVLEEFVVKRDQKCSAADTAADHSKEFYRLSLESLLTYSKSISESAIPRTSPYRAFLSKRSVLDQHAKEDNFYVFSHEMLLEFMAIQGLIECLKTESVYKRAVMLLMCSDPYMRNALQLTCAYISEYEPALVPDLVFLIQACLILQTEGVSCDQNKLTKKLLKLPELIKETVPDDVLSRGLTSKQAKIVDDIYRKIQKAFNKNAKSLQRAGWFSNGFENDWLAYYVPSAYHEFLTGCIRQCTPGIQEEVYRETVHKLLPCVRYNLMYHKEDGNEDKVYNYDHFVFPTHNQRWIEVKKSIKTPESKGTIISAWCPLDLAQALTQFTQSYRQHKLLTGEHDVVIELESRVSLWGVQPGEVLTHDKWLPALCQLTTQGVDDITIHTDLVSGTTPLSGLLTALQHAITTTHCLTGGVLVWHGQVSEEQLEEFSQWAGTVDLYVKLWDTRVLLSADHDMDYVTRLHQRVQDMMYSKRPPTYITPEGKTIKIPAP